MEILEKLLILFGYYIYLLAIAFIVGIPFLIVIIFVSNWIYKKFAKRLEEELRKKYEKEREEG